MTMPTRERWRLQDIYQDAANRIRSGAASHTATGEVGGKQIAITMHCQPGAHYPTVTCTLDGQPATFQQLKQFALQADL